MLMKTDSKLLKELENFDELNVPSLERLSYLLRHQELWPKNFKWNFDSCDHCAMGLAIAFWKLETPPIPEVYVSGDRISEQYRTTRLTFGLKQNSMYMFTHGYGSSITPEVIADRIDRHLSMLKLAKEKKVRIQVLRNGQTCLTK